MLVGTTKLVAGGTGASTADTTASAAAAFLILQADHGGASLLYVCVRVCVAARMK